MSKTGCRIARLGHVGIHVSDVDRSIDFYRKVLGLKVTGKWTPPDFIRPVCFMRCDELHHELVLFELPEDVDRSALDTGDSWYRRNVGVDHIAFQVDEREDWLNAIEHVRGLGIEIVDGPVVHGGEAEGRLSFRGGSGSHAFYFLDPDGNRIEIYCWMMRVTEPSEAAPDPDL
jgi:catechol 2,3-dioxygenase-like lactoylglutathione lyase family enzyme